ncbi:unnamed protein product, partial [Effrenium voratum]
MLAEGNSSLPEGGMQALPEHLAEGLELHLGAPVEQLHAGGDSDLERPALRLRGEGGVRGFDAVVLATDGPAARRLLPELPELPKTASCTWYFAVPGASMPVTEPLIVLNSTDQVEEDGLRLVNVGFPSLVQRSYAPVGWHLAAVTLRNGQGEEGWVRRQLADLFGRDVGDWQLLKVYRIPFHQPGQFPSQLWPPRDPRPSLKGIYLCGDFLAEPTLDSALRSGRRAAEAVLSDAKLAWDFPDPSPSPTVEEPKRLYTVSKLKEADARLHRLGSVARYDDDRKVRRVLAACGQDWRKALKLLASARGAAVRVGTLGFNTAMRCCVFGGQWRMAFEVAGRMLHDGVMPDKFGQDILANAGGSGQWRLAVEVSGATGRRAREEQSLVAALSVWAQDGLRPRALPCGMAPPEESWPLVRKVPQTRKSAAGCRELLQWCLLHEHNPRFAECAELALRSAFALVICGLPFLLPEGLFPRLDWFVDAGFYATTVVSFIVLHIKTNLGATLAATSSGLRGVLLAVCNSWFLFGLFPDGYTTDESDLVWWFGFAEGLFFIFCLVYLNFDTGAMIFSIKLFSGYW